MACIRDADRSVGAGGDARGSPEPLFDRGAAVCILDPELTGERLAKEVAHLLADRQALSRMSANARLFARPDAASRLAKTLVRFAEGRPQASEEATAGGGH